MKKIGIITNLKKREAKKKLQELVNWLNRKGKIVFVDEKAASSIKGKFQKLPLDDFASEVETIISLGGDGTLLRVARIKDVHKIPILGINLGGLGFITEISFSEIYAVLGKVLASRFRLEERMRLLIRIFKKGKEWKRLTALNELVLAKTTIARLLHLEIFINQDYLSTSQCDGLIVSTPTGSTGHSLSAGGPIMEPTLQGIIFTPICPHTLTNRPLIIPANKEVIIKAKPTTRTRDIAATIDGQEGVSLSFEDTVVVKKAPHNLKLIVSPQRSYYQILREKFSWGIRGHADYA